MVEFDYDALRRIGLNNQMIASLAGVDTAGQLYRITEIQRDRISLHDGQTEYRARALPRLLAESALCVGDWVIAEHNALQELWINHRLSPANQLTRFAADGNPQPLASNIDTALLVMGLDGDFNLRRLERYLALVANAQITPVIILSKPDICSDIEEKMAALRKRIPGCPPCFAVNGNDAASVAQLNPWLEAGQTICLLGSSGAGKSTLTNMLTGALQETGPVRLGDQRGRHTTTARSLHRCLAGACIIDTPGLRSLSPESVAAFDDIETLAAGCQFRDCLHEGEPGCAVSTHIDPDRLRNYHKLQREVRRHQQTALERIAERNKWKSLMKTASVRSRDKRR